MPLTEGLYTSTKDKLITLLLAKVGDYSEKWFRYETYSIDYKSVAEALTDYMQAESVKNTRLSNSYHASGTGDCIRKRTYSRIILPVQDFVPENFLSTIVGNFIGDSVQALMKSIDGFILVHGGALGIELTLGNVVTKELAKHYKAYQSGGRLDFLANGKSGPVMGDIKTIAGKYWQTKGGWPGWYSEKQQHWAKQISKEIYHYRSPEGLQAPHGLIFEVNRDTFEYRAWQFDYTSDISSWMDTEEFPDIKRAIGAVNIWVKLPLTERVSSILPPGQKDRCDKFCGYQNICPDNIY